MADRDFLTKLHKQLVDDGKLIEAGWVSLRIIAIPKDSSATQLSEMRMAFMSGAEHLFRSIMVVLEPGVEETELDLDRMRKIDDELTAFRAELEKRFTGARSQ